MFATEFVIVLDDGRWKIDGDGPAGLRLPGVTGRIDDLADGVDSCLKSLGLEMVAMAAEPGGGFRVAFKRLG